jgi:plasmid stabilization system protein ParE
MLEVAPEYAAALVGGIVGATEPLATFPRIGRTVPEFADDTLREIVFENYRIVYEIHGDAVTLLSVLHSAMDVATRLRRPGQSGSS